MSKQPSVTDGHFSEYTTRLFHIGFGDFITISLNYRYAVDKYGRRSKTPFSHRLGGTYNYREYPIWRFGIGLCTKNY